MSSRSSHPSLSCADGFATGAADFMQLIGRIMMGYLFLTAGWAKVTNIAGTTGYFTNLGVPSPASMPYLVGGLELIIGIALIVGLATRYAAIVTFLFVLVATLIAHRYWTYPAAAQGLQFTMLTKNLAIMGGSLFILILGAGRYSIDAALSKK